MWTFLLLLLLIKDGGDDLLLTLREDPTGKDLPPILLPCSTVFKLSRLGTAKERGEAPIDLDLCEGRGTRSVEKSGVMRKEEAIGLGGHGNGDFRWGGLLYAMMPWRLLFGGHVEDNTNLLRGEGDNSHNFH